VNLEQLGKFLIMVAIIIAVAGVFIFIIGKGLGIGKLPGDIVIKRDGTRVFIPVATMILLSIILTIVVNLVLWFLRR